MSKPDSLITAREIVEKYSLSYQTLNYYTSIGLFFVVKKLANQRLYYEPEIRQRIRRITHLKDEGYPLQLIQRALSSKSGRLVA